jgi:Ca-activated chloride channel family protein
MRFADWGYLFLLLLIPIFHVWWMKRNRPARVTYSLPIPALVGKTNPLRFLMLLKYLGLTCLIIALARPQSSFKQSQRAVNGIDIMMTLDFSASMNIEDLGEQSRMALAKEMMESFIKGRQNDRIGFVAFSGEAMTLSPPTLDYALLLQQLKNFEIGVLRDGTAIGDGLALAVSHLRNSKAKSRVIVLLTDGDNNLGQIDPATAGELAKGYGIRVYTIAIGKEGRVKMPIKSRTPLGNVITTYQWFDNALNPELLEQIAKITGGRFYRVTDESALESVFHEIDSLEKTEIKTLENVRYNELFEKPLKLGLLILALGLLLERGWWRILP